MSDGINNGGRIMVRLIEEVFIVPQWIDAGEPSHELKIYYQFIHEKENIICSYHIPYL